MSDLTHDSVNHAPAESAPQESITTSPEAGADSPKGVVVVVRMKPERVFGFKGKKAGKAKKPPEVSKAFATGSWFFAADFLDRVAEITAGECTGLRARPVQVEVSLVLDEKAYRHVEVILDSFDRAYRAL